MTAWRDRVRDALPIGDYLGTTKRTTAAPWDPDGSPSLKIDPDGRKWFDHRRGEGGDIFALIQAAESCTFPEACAIAADRSGIPEAAPSPQQAATNDARKALARDCLRWATALDDDTRASIRRAWNVTDEQIAAYAIGLADSGPLAGRIIIPWWQGGRIVYASGRVPFGSPERPKYRNIKGESLPRPPFFRGDRGPLIDGPTTIVEGYGDAIASPYRSAAVASDTAAKHAHEALARWAGPSIVLGDGDTAGRSGALTTAAALHAHALPVSLAIAPDGSDPAAEGPDGVRRMVGEASHYLLALVGSLPDCDRFSLGQYIDPIREALAFPHVDAVQRQAVRDAVAERYSLGKIAVGRLLQDTDPTDKTPKTPTTWTTDGPSIPDGYRVGGNGAIWRDDVHALPCTAWVAALLRDIETGDTHVHLRWRDPVDGPGEATVPADVVGTTTKITGLCNAGLQISSTIAKEAVRYFDACLSMQGLPRRQTTNRLGRVGDGFLSGDETSVGTVPALNLPPGTDAIRDALATEGTAEGWRAIIDDIASKDGTGPAQLAVWTSFASALLAYLPTSCPNVAVDFAGPRGSGKTISARLAASVWGTSRLISSWEGTWVSWETRGGVLRHHPLLMDESTKLARPDDAPRFVYAFANGEGRTRGARNGGNRQTVRFRGALIATGESPVVERSQDPGTRARVLTSWGSPLGIQDPSWASSIPERLAQHHGHAGAAFVAFVQATIAEDGAAFFAEQYAAARARYRAAESTADRQGQMFAVCALAGAIAEGAGLIPFSWEVADAVWASIRGHAQETKDPIEAALAALWEHAATIPGRMWADGLGSREPTGGWAGLEEDERPALVSGFAREWLSRQGHTADAIVRHWSDRGWVERDAREGLVRARLDRARVRVLRLTTVGLAVLED